METPPELPVPKPPLGARFYGLLIAPLVCTVPAFCFANNGTLGGLLMVFAGLVTLGTSIVLAHRLSQHFSKTGVGTIGMGILMFFALQAFYGVCFFVGCTTTIMLS